MRLLFTLLLIPLFVWPARAQTLSLDECTAAAIANFPITNNLDIIREKSALQDQIIRLNYLPGIQMKANANYQSDVVSFDLGMTVPGLTFPQMPHFQFKNTIDVNQVIYDGGLIARQLQMSALESSVQESEVKSRQYQIRVLTEALYLAIVLLKEQVPVLDLHLNTLESNRQHIQKLFSEGILLASDLDQLEVQLLESRLQQEQMYSDIDQLCRQLSRITGRNIKRNFEFLLNEPPIQALPIGRAELNLFQSQKDILLLHQKVLAQQNYPKIAAFGQAGYGRPGLNFLSDQWDTFFIAGLNFSWNLWDWNKTAKQRTSLQLQSDLVENEKNAFLLQVDLALIEEQVKIEKINQSILKQSELISLNDRILENSRQQLEGGSITMNTYLQNLNAAKIARQQWSLYKVQLAAAKQKLVTLTGN